MRLFFLFFVVVASLNVQAQCTKCVSLDEALKNPEGVLSLKENGTVTGVKRERLPASIGLLVNVEILYLSDHNFKIIPKEIGNLKKVKQLSFAGCKLEDLPDEIFTLSNLKELILFDNTFTEETIKALEEKFKKRLPGTKVLF